MASRLSRAVFTKARSVFAARSLQPAAPALQRWHSTSPAAEEADIVVETFVKQQKDFRAYISELQKIEIPMDPSDFKKVAAYNEEQKKIRAKLGVPSQTEKLSDLLESAFEESETLRSYLTTVSKLREEMHLQDPSSDAAMVEALDAVEAKLGQEVLTSDDKALEAWSQALSSGGKFSQFENEDLEKLEEEVELDAVKAEVEDYKKTAEDTLQTFKRRDGLDAISVELKELDPRPYL
eukprot:TRINITY_DN23155_c0_g1_i1.p1 TRINITY_DN23155_c0_g1~~TRINITY_DN23155_c0_g1_i1.p1  ORF type:complete len:237 (+),score=79.10 TRINITY_DN23155_c0_g1_i1:131-841(+)